VSIGGERLVLEPLDDGIHTPATLSKGSNDSISGHDLVHGVDAANP